MADSNTTVATRTILTDLRIWDGIRTHEADTLIINAGHVEALCPKSTLSAADARQAVSLRGATAVPGLIDAHVHMVLDPDRSTPPSVEERPDPVAMQERAAQMVAAGITTARDLGGGAWMELDLRDRIQRGEIIGPRLICSGQPITSPHGHCHFWGGEAADLDAALQILQRQVDHGVDLIKVMATGGRFTRGSSPVEPQFDTQTLTEIVGAARALDLPVAAHCHGTPGIEAAAQAGVRTIEHCSWVGTGGWASDYQPDITELMVNKGTWVSPTINRGWQRMLNANGDTLKRMRHALIAMREAGIPFMASTDAGIPGVYHHHLPEALKVFAEVAALSPEQTLLSATSNAALGLGLADRTGQLRQGYDADVLVVDGDPIADLARLTQPIGIWARGRCILQS
jgi:imidazolonepropionase-like amidohydrolase